MARSNEETNGASKEPVPPFLRRRFLSVPTLVSFVVAGAFIAFLWTRFDIDLSLTWAQVKGSSPGYYALAIVAYYLTFPVRAFRWRLLLDNVDTFRRPGSHRPSLPGASKIILLSWFANSVMWFRLGDAYRAYLLSSQHNASFSRTIGTVAAERFIDIAAVFGLLLAAGIGLIVTGDDSAEIRAVEFSALALAGVGVLVLVSLRVYGVRLTHRLPARLQPLADRFLEGTFGSFRQLPKIVVLSVVVWLLEALRLYFVVQAVGFEVGLALVLLAALAHSMLTTIPLTPGGLGFVELGLAGLLALSLTSGDATVVTVVDRSITYVTIVAFGGLVFATQQLADLRGHLSLRPKAGRDAEATKQSPLGPPA